MDPQQRNQCQGGFGQSGEKNMKDKSVFWFVPLLRNHCDGTLLLDLLPMQ